MTPSVRVSGDGKDGDLRWAGDGALWLRGPAGLRRWAESGLTTIAESVGTVALGPTGVAWVTPEGAFRANVDGSGPTPMAPVSRSAGLVWAGSALWTVEPSGERFRIGGPDGAAWDAVSTISAWGDRAVWLSIQGGVQVVADPRGVVVRLDGDIARIW